VIIASPPHGRVACEVAHCLLVSKQSVGRHLCCEPTGRERVYTHATARPLAGELSCEADEGAL
jgi:hypothetical protein